VGKVSAPRVDGCELRLLGCGRDEAPAHRPQALLTVDGDDGLDDLARGDAQTGRPGRAPGYLKVFCNGVPVSEFAVSFGDFEHVVPLKTPLAAEMLEVTIEASRSFVPSDEGINDDPRVLAYLLREVA